MSEPGEHLHDWVDCERASLRAIIGDEPLPRRHERNLRWMCPGCGADEPRLLPDQVAVITADRDAYRDALRELVERVAEVRTLENREYETDEYDDGLQSAIAGALHRR